MFFWQGRLFIVILSEEMKLSSGGHTASFLDRLIMRWRATENHFFPGFGKVKYIFFFLELILVFAYHSLKGEVKAFPEGS